MIKNKRTLTYVAIALIVGAALALAVALAPSGPAAPGQASTGAQTKASSDLLAETGVTGSTGDPLNADPAKAEPLLDKFVSKDPFVPLGTTSTVDPGSTSGTDTSGLGAKVKVNGTSYSVLKGDQVPGGGAAFVISSITSGDVTFGVVDGTTKSGESSVAVSLGESVKVPLESGKSYTLSVTSIGKSSSSTNGHTISVLSVTQSNGTAMATIEVDGKTYSDKVVGAVFSTSWGEIKVIAISTSAQTVTIMHGDQTITLHAGQVVVK